VIEQYELGDRVSHDTFGLGRVVGVEASAVTVDFRSHSVRIVSPFRKLEKF
jgi:transcription elongation factor GreA-like protein